MRLIFLVLTWSLLDGLAWAEAPKANLVAFRKEIEPVLKAACTGCHGPKKQKAQLKSGSNNSRVRCETP